MLSIINGKQTEKQIYHWTTATKCRISENNNHSSTIVFDCGIIIIMGNVTIGNVLVIRVDIVVGVWHCIFEESTQLFIAFIDNSLNSKGKYKKQQSIGSFKK